MIALYGLQKIQIMFKFVHPVLQVIKALETLEKEQIKEIITNLKLP